MPGLALQSLLGPGTSGQAGSREQSLLKAVPPEFTGLHCQAVWAETRAHEEQNTGRFAGWKTGGVRKNFGNGSNGRFHPPSAAGFVNVQLSVGFVGDGFIAPFHLQHTLEEVLGTETLKSSSW